MMAVGTPVFVRSLEPSEMRRVARASGLILLVYAVWNPVVHFNARGPIVRPDLPSWLGADLHTWIGVATAVMGLALLLAASVTADSALSRLFAGITVVALLFATVAMPSVMWMDSYPMSGVIAMGYVLIAIFAFYVLTLPAAFALVGMACAGQWVLEGASQTPWPVWLLPAFIGLLMSVAGYFIAQLMQELGHSRDRLAALNLNLETEVATQVDEVERLGRLRRFLSAPVAEAVLSSDAESILGPHRREIAVLFCDLRGFTSFASRVEPEEVMEVLEAYYSAVGEQTTRFRATLGAFEGDGIMAYLNDPNPCDAPAREIVEMAVAIAEAIDRLTPIWTARGYSLSYGIGMAFGHATLGAVGFDGRTDYTALGTVVNLGARLCSIAEPRQLIADHRVFLAAAQDVPMTPLEPQSLKGFSEPISAYLVTRAPHRSL